MPPGNWNGGGIIWNRHSKLLSVVSYPLSVVRSLFINFAS